MPRQPSRETSVKAKIQNALNRGPVRLFRNNVGAFRTPSGGFVAFGLGSSGGRKLPGTSDLIGWCSVVITPAMVGQTIAVFAAVEIKDQSRSRFAQRNFIKRVRAAGGLAGIATDIESAKHVLNLR